MIGVQVAGNEAEGGRRIGRAFEFARGAGAGGVAIGQQTEADLRGVGYATSGTLAGINGREVKLGNHVDDAAGEVVRRQTVAQAHGLVEGGLVIDSFEGSTHVKSVTLTDRSGEGFSPTNC